MSEWVTVARVDELAPGEWRVADADGAQVAVFNLDGHYYAIEDVCTHDAGQLTGGSVEGDQIVCPRHGARFCIRTGVALCAPLTSRPPFSPCASKTARSRYATTAGIDSSIESAKAKELSWQA